MTDEPEPNSAAAEVAGAAAAAVLGLLLGGPAGAVAGNALARPLTELVRGSWAELVAFREGNVEAFLTQAADQADIDPEEIVTKAQDDSQVNRLFQASLVAAAEALDREKIAGLAKCLANGIKDTARVDEEAVIVRALADLDPVHVRVLAELDESPRTADEIDLLIAGETEEPEYLRAPKLSIPVMTVLERNGLANRRAAPPGYDCTDFGRECLERLGHTTRGTRRQLIAKIKKGPQRAAPATEDDWVSSVVFPAPFGPRPKAN